MSLKLNERYPGRYNNPSADYPQGSFKNRTTPVAKDGSYLEQDWANDKEGFFQSLLSKAGVLANGLIDKVGASQYFDALIQTRQVQTGVAFTSAGVSPALTLTPSPAITAYSANQRFRVKFAAASTGSDTLNISGLGAKNIKQYSATGAKVAAVFAASQLSDVEYDGVDFVLLDQLPSLPQATEAVLGGGKIATQALTSAGTDDATIVTPKKLQAKIAGIVSGQYPMTPGAQVVFNHNLGVVPFMVEFSYVCVTAEGGWSPGDVLHRGNWYQNSSSTDGSPGIFWYGETTTQVTLGLGSTIQLLPTKTTGLRFAITAANWRFTARVIG